jgi:hypothetical protein
MFTFLGIIVPLVILFLQHLYNKYDPNCIVVSQKDGPRVLSEWQKNLFYFVNMLLPIRWKALTPTPPQDVNTFKLLQNDRLVVRFSSYLSILLVYGVLFPPLAVVAVISIFSITYFEQFAISKLLMESKVLGYTWYQDKILKECEYIAESWFDTLKIILPFASFSYAFVVFDTLGDKYGWKVAVGPSLFVFSLPWWFFAFQKLQKQLCWLSRYDFKMMDFVLLGSEVTVNRDENDLVKLSSCSDDQINISSNDFPGSDVELTELNSRRPSKRTSLVSTVSALHQEQNDGSDRVC